MFILMCFKFSKFIITIYEFFEIKQTIKINLNFKVLVSIFHRVEIKWYKLLSKRMIIDFN